MTASKIWRSLTGLWAICVLSLLLWNARTLPPATVAAGGVDEITCGFEWDYPYFEIWADGERCLQCQIVTMYY